MSLYDDVFGKLEQVRGKYPARGMTPQQLGSYLNEVTLPFAILGVGLEAKVGGDVAVLPDGTTISHDVIRFPGSVGADMLTDAEGVAAPQRGELKPATAKFVSPVQVIDNSVPLPGDSGPGSVVVPDLDMSKLIEPVLAELTNTREAINNLRKSLDMLNKNGIKVHF